MTSIIIFGGGYKAVGRRRVGAGAARADDGRVEALVAHETHRPRMVGGHDHVIINYQMNKCMFRGSASSFSSLQPAQFSASLSPNIAIRHRVYKTSGCI